MGPNCQVANGYFWLYSIAYFTVVLFLTANDSLKKIDLSVNEEYGYLSFSISKLLSLPPVVMIKVIQILIAHIGGERRPLNNFAARFHRKLLSRDRRIERLCGCILFIPDDEDEDSSTSDTMVVGRAPPTPTKQILQTSISLGQTVHWDARWRITLKPLLEKLSRQDSGQNTPDEIMQSEEQLVKLDRQDSGKEASDGLAQSKEQFYVRNLTIEECWERKEQANYNTDWGYAEIPPYTRLLLGLPVVCTESGHVVLAPHFNILNRSYGVDCDVTFDPLLPLIQDLDTIIY